MIPPGPDPIGIDHPLSVGRVVRHRRRQLGLRQHDLAAAVGVQYIWISKLENGHDGLDFSRVLRTFAALNLDLGFIAHPGRPAWMDGFVKQRIPRAPVNGPKEKMKAKRGLARPRRGWAARALPGTAHVDRPRPAPTSGKKQRPLCDR